MTGILKTGMLALLASTAFAGASQGVQFNSSVGRIVWGHPMKLVPRTDIQNKPIMKDDGTPAMCVNFGLAIPKAQFLANEWPQMAAEAAKGYPNGVPSNFSWKMKDADTEKDSNGNPLSAKEGYAGCYILTVTSNTGFPPAVYKFNGSTYDQMTADQIKCGDWISVALHVQLNIPAQRTHTPSLYINPQAIEFVAYDKEIISAGISPMQAFGGRQHQLPPGASLTPVGGAGGGVQMPGVGGGMPGAPAGMPGQPPMGAPGGYQQPPMQPQQMQQPVQQYQQPPMQPQYAPQQPGQLPPPAPDFVQQAGMQPGGYPQPQQPQQMPGNGMPPQYAAPGTPPAPMQAPGYPVPGQAMPATGYPSNPQQPQQPAPGGYPPQMPGMMPGR